MSESDDTDVLLLIPPDLFVVPLSDSEEDSARGGNRQSGVVSEILDHVQSLEHRISAIESRDNSLLDVSLLNTSLDSHRQSSSSAFVENSPGKYQYPPRRDSSQFPDISNSQAKPFCCSSAKSSPARCPMSVVTNTKRNAMKLGTHAQAGQVTNPLNAYSWSWKKHDDPPKSADKRSASAFRAAENSGCLPGEGNCHGAIVDPPVIGATGCSSVNYKCTDARQEGVKDVGDMELSEVDELLQEMEATEAALATRINSSNANRNAEESTKHFPDSLLGDKKTVGKSPMRRLDFQFVDEELRGPFKSLDFRRLERNNGLADVSLPDEDALQLEDITATISDFKIWEGNDQPSFRDRGNTSNREKTNGNPGKMGGDPMILRSDETSDAEVSSTKNYNSLSLPNMKTWNAQRFSSFNGNSRRIIDDKISDTVDSGAHGSKESQTQSNEVQQPMNDIRATGPQRSSYLERDTDECLRKSQGLFTLSDFWGCNGSRSPEEMLRIKLEEEKFRREHCEHLIQELQKRLLEEQEKVAVAIRVDNEKTKIITSFHISSMKYAEKCHALDKDRREMEGNLKNMTTKNQAELEECQQQIRRSEGELSKALDLAAGYKEKSDSLVKEKFDLLKSHADELENYKSLVQDAEQRNEDLRIEYNKISERNKQLEEMSGNAQQELNKERLRNSEVRAEMNVIHKALDACEAELTILRQEKESLQLKIKEESARNEILAKNKMDMLEAINDARNAEKSAKDEIKLFADRQEQIRTELREVYQNQVDEVVKTKLKEFQEQLDAAEMVFQSDLETRQRAIAECAARKIKSIIDKHQLEINLLEEKHMEEKRLAEIQLAQAFQRAAMLEVQLSTQRTTKTHLAEQLHSVMQKQWQQALQIISGGQMENYLPLQGLNPERMIEARKSKRCNSACCNKEQKPGRSEMRSLSVQNLPSSRPDESLVTVTSNDESPPGPKKESKNDLRNYIKMILDMQQSNKDYIPKKTYVQEGTMSPPLVSREVPRKHYTKKEPSNLTEESVTWQRVDDQSIHDTSDYMQIPQSQGSKTDHGRNKPPWK